MSEQQNPHADLDLQCTAHPTACRMRMIDKVRQDEAMPKGLVFAGKECSPTSSKCAAAHFMSTTRQAE